jgi:hypothetical protein
MPMSRYRDQVQAFLADLLAHQDDHRLHHATLVAFLVFPYFCLTIFHPRFQLSTFF